VGYSGAEISFLAMGDSPYEDKEYFLIEKELENLPENAKFIIHLGDIKPKERDCGEDNYKDFRDLLKRSPIPVFIIPGDNGYSICNDRAQAKQFWDQYILDFEKNWKLKFPVKRQKEQLENFSFFLENTLFIGINLFEKNDRDNIKFNQILRNNIFWIKENLKQYQRRIKTLVIFAHDFSGLTNKTSDYIACGNAFLNSWAKKTFKNKKYFSDQFVSIAQEFKKPILYMQGNHHCWSHDQPYKEAKNIERIVVNKIENSPMVQITPGDNNFVVDQRINKKINIFIDTAKLGDTWSQFFLGAEYLRLNDKANAKKWLLKASNQNFPPAQVLLGVFLRDSNNYADALKLLHAAVQDQNFKNKKATPLSYQKRIVRFQKETLIKSKYDGFFELGAMYLAGLGLPKNHEKSLQYFQKASEGNVGVAHHYIGAMYLKGLGVKKDFKKAKSWFIKGASRGVQRSKYMLGNMYLNGQGVKKDYKEAIKWFKDAKKDAPNLLALGRLYLYGLGVALDRKTAIKYFKSAETEGSIEAKGVLKNLGIIPKK